MPDSEAKKKWMKENLWLVALKIHRKHDADIVDFLESQNAEKQKIIKKALREYMKNHPNE